MKLSNKLNFIWILILVVFASCEKDLDHVKLPELPAKLVLSSFISPQDSIVSVVVSKSSSYFDNRTGGANFVTNANVSISDGTNTVQIPFMGKYYAVPATIFPIVAGKTYTLSVKTPDGMNASATCTVPVSKNTSLNYSIDTVTRSGDTELLLNLSWTDVPGEFNFYRTMGEAGYFFQGTYYFEQMYFESAEFVSDEGKDGRMMYRKKGNFDDFADVTRLTLLTTDKHYYLFHKSANSAMSNNPFSEPTLVYTNVTGGLGVFAAYNSFVLQF